MPTITRTLPRSLALLLALLFPVFLLAGCEVASSPELIQVLDLTPREAEVGDRLVIIGQNFPQGRTAFVTFRGTLYRPGVAPLTGMEIAAEATVTSPQRAELAMTEALQASFCGPADKAEHTTFEGELEVAFAAATSGAPPVAGTLRAASLDVHPPPLRPAMADARAEQARRLLSFAGLRIAPRPGLSGGFEVEHVTPGSRADEAGVLAGDVITKFGHVRVGSLLDFVPAEGARSVTLGLRRPGMDNEQVRELSLEGFRAAPTSDLLGAVALVAAAVVIVLSFVAPTPDPLARLETALVGTLVRVGAAKGRAGIWKAARGWLARKLATARAATVFALAGLSVLLVALPWGSARGATDVNVVLGLLVLTTALVTTAVVTATSWRDGLGAVVRALTFKLPVAAAVMAVVASSGSVYLHEIVRTQGGAPWTWNALRTPMTFALFLVASFYGSARGPARSPLGTLAARLHSVLACALTTALFLGGWQLPGADGEAHGRALLAVVGGLGFLLKTYALLATTEWIRSASAPSPTAWPWYARRGPVANAWRRAIPVSVGALLATFGWIEWGPSPDLERFVSVALFSLVAVAMGHLGWRVARRVAGSEARKGTLREPTVEWARVNPFL